jgi:MFS family permease
MNSPFQLLNKRRFLPFFLVQFLVAFNDNLFKNALIVLVTFHATSWTTLAVPVINNIASGLFILPSIVLSPISGQLADKYDRALITRLTKMFECAVALLVIVGFWLHSLWILMGALCLLGIQVSLFGPVKYAILPQHLRSHELVAGNALVESGTFLAILLGSILGATLAGLPHGEVLVCGAVLLVAVSGYALSREVPPAPPPDPTLLISKNPFKQTLYLMRLLRTMPLVKVSIWALSVFWMYGLFFLSQLPVFVESFLHASSRAFSVLMVCFVIGIGLGSFVCEKVLRRINNAGNVVVVSAFGLALAGLDFAYMVHYFSQMPSPSSPSGLVEVGTLLQDLTVWRVIVDLILLGFFGGMYCVPLYTWMQVHSDEKYRARVVSINNILNAWLMVLGAAIAAILFYYGLKLQFLVAMAAFLLGVYAFYLRRCMAKWVKTAEKQAS